MSGIFIPSEFALALAGVSLTGVTLVALNGFVGKARKEAGVPYPALYADNAEASKDKKKHRFNCAQRGVQNLLETYTTVTVATLITGLWNPRVALGISIAYSIGAYGFAKGYATGNPDARYGGVGVLIRPAQLAALFCSFYSIYNLYTQ
mmetsp:Transcript_22348/g.37881  ORF Transcript_22348/g.37881 Transcript_22348/m.37881 type:complete len:149 (+) Transcript_22348:86-532(+)